MPATEVAARATQMAHEIAEIPTIVERQIADGLSVYREEGMRLRALEPRFVITCARGTSDHAATYFKYLLETGLGLPTVSIGPSVASVYRTRLSAEKAICLLVSQSGGSPDLLAFQRHAKEGGARTTALLNVTDSPVGHDADSVLPMLAGPEHAVAATKSYVASLVALAAVYGGMAGDEGLLAAVERLPEALAEALEFGWSEASMPLVRGASLFTVSRGPGLSIANEAALKFKETCRLHAEAYSAAEVRHGPIALARERFTALVFMPVDESRQSVLEAAAAMRSAGATVLVVDSMPQETGWLGSSRAPHPMLVPICQAVSFYRYVEELSALLGENPDAPPNLRKVTLTT